MKTILSAVLMAAVLGLATGARGAEPAAAKPDEAKAEPAKSDAKAEPAKPDAKAEPAKSDAKAESAPADAPKVAAPVQLIEGAPLGNANVNVHIVQQKPYTNQGRFELTVYPAVAQLNAKFTEHYGVGLMLSYHLFENLALQLTPLWNYWNCEAGFNKELVQKGNIQAQAATAVLLNYGAVLGVEVTPVYGKFAFYEGTLAHFSFVLNAGGGVGSTRVQLSDRRSNCGGTNEDGTTQPACQAFGDTGFRFLGSVGAGFRVLLGDHVAVRLEVRDLVYTARVDKINGCNKDDVTGLKDDANFPVSGGCSASAFHRDDLGAALALLKQTSSDVINEVSFYAGVSFLF